MTQRINNPYLHARPAVMPAPQGIPRVKLIDGGITDKNENELIQLGNVVNIPPPPTALGGASSFWINGSGIGDEPGGRASTNQGTILQARSRLADHPETINVNINPPLFDLTDFNAVDFDLKVRAQWGVGANRASAVIDIVNGAQLSIVATELVITGLYTLNDLQGVPTGPTLQIGASIGQGARGASEFGPCFTATIIGVLAAGTVDIVVPSYAKAVTVYMSSPALAPSAVTIGFVRGVAAAPFINILQAASDIRTYPLPNDVSRIRLTAPGGNAIQGYVRFDLAL